MGAGRHIVVGSRGTAVIASHAVALIDAAPASEPAVAWEALLFDDAGPVPIDPLAELDPELLTSFVLVEASQTGTTITRNGAASVVLNDRPWSVEGDTATTSVGPADPVTVSIDTDDTPTGQWASTGVLAASAVVVGALTAPAARLATRVQPTISADLAPDGADFGSLLGGLATPLAPDVDPAEEFDDDDSMAATATATATATAAVSQSKTDETAAFLHPEAIAPDAVLRVNDGRTFPVTRPIVFGRRPPGEPINGQTPQAVAIDDPLISRHHATVFIVDGRLVVVDEGSTNGTWVHAPGEPPVRCAPNHPTGVGPGSVIDIAGVLQAVHEGSA